MDFAFLSVTFFLIIFLLISYYLNVLRLSTPLILIYLIFCFTYVIDSEKVKGPIVKIDELGNSVNDNSISEQVESLAAKDKKIDKLKNKKSDISKPVVSFNPKPIIIDTNIIIKKDKENNVVNNSESIEKTLNIEKQNKDEFLQALKLNEVMICRGVYKRNPIKPGFNFTNDVDSLFCYTKISNSGSKQEIKHLWYFQEKLVTSVVYNIKTSYNYRSWSKKTILPSQVGKWRVDIIDIEEKILGSRKFEISSKNNAF